MCSNDEIAENLMIWERLEQEDLTMAEDLTMPDDEADSALSDTKAEPALRSKTVQVLLVLGMHRSGTSALTRVFSLLGADLPKNLDYDPSDKTTHWESSDFIGIHDDILLTAGSRWDDWREFNPDWIRSSVAESYKKKLLDVLKARLRW